MEVRYKFDIGDIVIDNGMDITITDRKYEIKTVKSKNTKSGYTDTKIKYYKYKCNRCGWDCTCVYDLNKKYMNDVWIREEYLCYSKTKSGCSVCNPHPVYISPSINSIVSHKEYLWMINYFNGDNYEDKYAEASKYSPQSNMKYFFTCPLCNRKKQNAIPINKLYIHKSIGCICSDNISYPNKFIYSLITQVNVDFYKMEYSPKWARPYRYDCYFEINNNKIIVEMDGDLGHGNKQYKSSSKDVDGKNRDNKKEKIAAQHNIILIRIDCKKSDVNYIKNSIINSKLTNFINLENINWIQCDIFANKNLIKEVCDFYNNNKELNNTEIGKTFGISKITVGKYLRIGSQYSWCNYIDEVKERCSKITVRSNGNKTKVISNSQILGIFDSASKIEKESEKLFGTKLFQSQISKCCKTHKEYKGFIFEYA